MEEINASLRKKQRNTQTCNKKEGFILVEVMLGVQQAMKTHY